MELEPPLTPELMTNVGEEDEEEEEEVKVMVSGEKRADKSVGRKERVAFPRMKKIQLF